ncbi:non-ribosomal peptide synthetase [Streptomyces rimosus]|uniref:non-ribosomal peptide synthetase n=1 Tax=Streptomyces rimosus TaxID=1927 RepID=UPI00067B2F34|nr:non-ribosomal peptide synthetase [Streptomyces rimosus]
MTTSVPLPLSAAQHAVLLDGRDRAADCLAQYLDVAETVRPEVLREALRRAVDECAALRVVFRRGTDGTVQSFPTTPGPDPDPDVAPGVVEVDVRTGPDAGGSAVAAWTDTELARPLDPFTGPAYRVALFLLPGGRLGWFQRFHRLVLDEAGMAAFAARVGQHCAATAAGEALPLPLAGPADRLAEEDAYRRSPGRAADHRYWRELLTDVPGPVPALLPAPHGAPAPVAASAGHFVPLGAAPAVLARAARRSGGGPAAVLLAALAVHAHRRTGSRDLVLGHWTTPAGPGGATLVPVRIAVTPDLTFAQVAKRAGAALRRARRHRFLADADLSWSAPAGYGAVAAFEPAGGSSGTVVRTWGAPGEGLSVRARETPDGDWHLEVREGAAPDDRGAGDRLPRLLAELVAAPDVPVGRFDLATPNELRRVQVEFNDSAQAVPESTVTADFAAVVRRTPDAVAVRGRDGTLTYAELNERATRLAVRLRQQGIGPEDLVAVLLPRTPDMVTAVLGVLLAGAAYLPVDPAYPAGRIAFLLDDARPRAVLTSTEQAPHLPDGAPPAVLLDAPGPGGPLPAFSVRPGNAAYVIYTSGSTGQPKGVVVTHRAVHNFARWSTGALGAEAFTRVLGATSLSFDMSVFEILVPLMTGGSVELVGNLLSLLTVPDWSGSLINTVPSVYRKVIAAEWVRERADHYVFCGEPLPAELVREVLRRSPGATVHNIYGPTEVTVYATSWRCPPQRPDDPTPPPIGTPVTNVRCHVLDAALRPVPVGHTGELYLAGDYLARGYAGRPGLTAERFLADPFGPPGGRMYRTGDLARWNADGQLEFIGRADHQVKVHGHRVEPGEIEALLTALPEVAAAAVVATDDGEGDRRLTAFAVAAEGHRPGPAAVRERLAAGLPAPLVPAAIVFVDALPLNPNGKTDRPALQARAAALPATAGADGPETAASAEDALRQVFAQVLDRAEVGAHDSFFAVGGDSIRSIKLVRRAREAGWVIQPEDVFEHKTPAGLAGVAVPYAPEARHTSVSVAAPEARVPSPPPREPLLPLDAGERDWLARHHPTLSEVLPLTPLQEGLLFHGRYDRDGEDAYVMQMTLDMTGALDVPALRRACDLLCHRHPNLRSGFVQLPSGRAVQVVPERGADFTEVDLSGLDGERQRAEADRIAGTGRRTRFDPADPPLIRFALLRLGTDRYRLLVTAHHILLDGWSNQLFLPELFALYRAPEDVPAPTPYRDYLDWLHRQDRQASLRTWCEALGAGDGVPRPTLLAPSGLHRTSMWPTRLAHTLTRERTDTVTEFAGRHGVTVNTLLQCCWGLLLAEWTGRPDVLFGTIVSGRSPDVPGVESMVGFLINALPVRVRTVPGETLGALLRRVQQEQSRLLAHHHVGLTDIQRAVGADELFDTALVYENFPVAGDQRAALPGIEITGATSETAGHYPLSLMAIPRDGRLEFHFLYRPDVFTREAVDRMLARLLRLLTTVVTAPDTPLAALDLLDADEHATVAAHRGAASTAPRTTVTALLDAQAARTPDAPAVRWAGGTGGPGTELSYADLHARANRTARELAARGAGPESYVGLLLPRSPELAVALLAVLKAGAAVVPLDPDHPDERLRLILDGARPTLVITGREHAAAAPLDGVGTLVLDDDGTAAAIAARPAGPLDDGARTAPLLPDHPAYLIHTSGTSGRPKGVVVPHGGLPGVLGSTVPARGAGPGSRILQFGSPGFDGGLIDYFETLTSGATLVLAPEDRLRPGRALTELAHRERITGVCVPPSVLAVLTPGESLPPGTLIRCGGEVLPAELAARWAAHHPLVNAYGPTEATVAATTTGILPPGAGAPVGRPVDGTVVHLLDTALRPVGPGRPGEVYLGGSALARGYLGQAALTAERFVADPFASGGGRMYRTGDTARWNADGQLEFLGRTDRQIKIRGFRVEPGETEAALAGHPAVASAAVRPWSAAPDDIRLVAYVVPERRCVAAEVTGPAAEADTEAGTEGDIQADIEAELIREWESVYADLRSEGTPPERREPFAADFSGWDSTYDGSPIPAGEMLEWRAATVERIRELRPSRVLEIGAGNGLILSGVAPHCDRYVATDFSLPAVEGLRADLARSPDLAARTEVRHQAAHDVSGLEPGAFDVVVLNSVIQYFPSRAYLLRVIEGARELLAPGGALFLGDVRDARLRDRLFTAAECAAAAPTAPVSAVLLAAGRRTLLDEELAVAPEFFGTLDGWAGADIRLKRGRHDNELTRYRYDVVLHKDAGTPVVPVGDAVPLRWGSDVRTPEELAALLRAAAAPMPVRVSGIPDARLAADTALRDALLSAPPGSRVGALGSPPAGAGVHPEDLADLGPELGYRVLATPSAVEGEFDVVLVPGDDADRFRDVHLALAGTATDQDAVHDPAVAAGLARLPGILLDALRGTLPEYAVPATVVVLPALPRTPNGKTDHAALPDPERSAGTTGRRPRTAQERRLCAVFAEVLGLPSVGVDDNFFDLGGHSLLATRLARRLETAGAGRVDTSVVYAAPTVAALAEHLGTDEPRPLAFDVLLPLRPVRTPHGTGRGDRAGDDPPPLFCVHPAGGIGWMYAALMRHLGSERPLYALQCRGLDGEGQLPRSVEEMAADYLAEIRSVAPTGPYDLLGWSYGGMVAHAMATALQEQGETVRLLALLDAYVMADVPGLPPADAFGSERALYGALLDYAGLPAGTEGPGAWSTPDDLTPERFLEIVGTADNPLSGISAEQLLAMGRVYRNNVALAADFRPAKFAGDLLFVAARRDVPDPVPALTPDLWAPYVTEGRVTVHHSDFAHPDLGSPAALAEIGRLLTTELRTRDTHATHERNRTP